MYVCAGVLGGHFRPGNLPRVLNSPKNLPFPPSFIKTPSTESDASQRAVRIQHSSRKSEDTAWSPERDFQEGLHSCGGPRSQCGGPAMHHEKPGADPGLARGSNTSRGGGEVVNSASTIFQGEWLSEYSEFPDGTTHVEDHRFKTDNNGQKVCCARGRTFGICFRGLGS